MYTTNVKVGRSIAVYGVRPNTGTSTLAAMTASLLAARGERTLLLSTDSDIPYDAVSMLSDEITENHLDELTVLENSNGLAPGRMDDYVTFLTDNLGFLRASTNMTRLTKNPARTISNIIDIACYDFHYVVVDIGFAATQYANAVIQSCDMVMHTLGQDPKSISAAADIYKHNGFGKDKLVVPIVVNFRDDVPANTDAMAKQLGVDEVFAIYHDDDVYKAGAGRKTASYVHKGVKKKGGFLGLRKKKNEDDTTAVDELGRVCDLIVGALNGNEKEGD